MWRSSIPTGLRQGLWIRDWGLGSLEDSLAGEEGFQDGDLPGDGIETEADQVGAVSRIQAALAVRNASNPGGIPRGEGNGFAQAEAGHPHHVRDGLIHP